MNGGIKNRMQWSRDGFLKDECRVSWLIDWLDRVYNYLFNYFAFVGTAIIEEKEIIFNPFLLHIN